MRLFKKWFINPTIQKQIVLLEIKRMMTVDKLNPKMSMERKAELFCKENEIQFAIDVLEGML